MIINSKIDIGRVRKANQDACFVKVLPDGSALAVVCDGMGGAKAGNVASESAVRLITEYVIRSCREDMNEDEYSAVLCSAVTSANLEIYDMSLKRQELTGMGTTVVSALVRDDFAVVCHVGDSRAYLVGDGIEQITRDHSVVQTLVESGRLTPEEAKVHPKKNVITRALGTEENVLPDIDHIKLRNGETLLLCTDGLTNYVDPPDILKVFGGHDINEVAGALVNMANSNGGGDNITVVTVTI